MSTPSRAELAAAAPAVAVPALLSTPTVAAALALADASEDGAGMRVIKRDGRLEDVSFDKVLERVRRAGEGLRVNVTFLAQQVLTQLVDRIRTSDLDDLTASLAASLTTTHPDYGVLAARVAISNHQKATSGSFRRVVEHLYNTRNQRGEASPLVSHALLRSVRDPVLGPAIEARIDYERDFLLDYFGFRTLEKAYLLRDESRRVVERPAHMWMRVALGLWLARDGTDEVDDLERAFELYDLMSTKKYTHATPTLFNSGTRRPQLASCFLNAMRDDSIEGIFETLQQCAMISKGSGGIGLHISNIRAKGSLIAGTNGTSNGIVPMLKVFNNTARYVDQCFPPGTLVYTEAGPKAIEDVGVTDRVLTSTGFFAAVNAPVRHDYDGPMRAVTVQQSAAPVRMTPEHQVLALRGVQAGLSHDDIRAHIDRKLLAVEFCDARHLRVGDFLVTPIPTHVVDIPQLTEEDCRFYGILLGSGTASLAKEDVRITLDDVAQAETLRFLRAYCAKRAIAATEHGDADSKRTVHTRVSPRCPGYKFTRAQLHDTAGAKRVDVAFLHLPLAKVVQVVRGLLETAGCVGPQDVTLVSTSAIIESVRYMMLRLGAVTSGASKGGIHTLHIPHVPEVLAFFPGSALNASASLKHGDKLYARIEAVADETFTGGVHDFEIDAPHDYTIAHAGVVHNGGGKRNGSFAIYIEPWHADVEDFLRLKLNTGAEEERARDLFYALWVPDLFMERLAADGEWSLFCPSEAPGLADVVGDAFTALYERYEAEGKARKRVPVRKLWNMVMDSQIETGTPYILFKDAANRKSNQQHVGVIKSSNLCSEIIEYSDKDETAVCTLASLCLPAFVRNGGMPNASFDFAALRAVVRTAIRNLDRVITINYYPTPETERSNMRHRPVGLGVQGLADVFAMHGLAWDDPGAATLNKRIFAHIYHAAATESAALAAELGAHPSFPGSPASEGRLQFDLWGYDPRLAEPDLDWDGLRAAARRGMRNSLLVAPMPTASTSQVMGWTEAIEPAQSMLFKRNTLAGEFVVLNKHLVSVLFARGLWSPDLKDRIVANGGSVQGLAGVPSDLQRVFRTAWELKQRTLIDLAADRGPFVCQSQSLNLFVADPTYAKLYSMHMHAWRQGLKTGVYYTRTRSTVQAQQFSVDPRLARELAALTTPTATPPPSRNTDNAGAEASEGCLMCSS